MLLSVLKTRTGRSGLFLLCALLYSAAVAGVGQVSGAYFDSEQYVRYGWNLLETGEYGIEPGKPDMNREAGYPVYLAALFFLLKQAGIATGFTSLLLPAQLFWVKALQALTLFLCAGFAAFCSRLPERLRWPLFLLGVLSPSCIGVAREIYSEALAIPLAFLLVGFISIALAKSSRPASVAAGLVFAAMVFTKSYLYFGSLLFLGLALLSRLPRFRGASLLPALLLFSMGAGGLAAQQAWNLRNQRLFGENASEARLSIALAGKVARLHEADWPRDLGPALAGSLGTNFCDGLFGADRCSRFDYRGCDVIGLQHLVRYKELHGTNRAADSALKRDMALLWLKRPVTQLFGSGLELLRMFFFEAVMDAGTLPGMMRLPARAWHLVGSLAFWAFILISLTRHRRHWARLGAPERGLAVLFVLVIAYHAASMAQITNVVRYVFPILPFLYYFTADGISVLLERKRAWTTRPAPRKA